MALRITKKDRQKINQVNTSIRNKMKKYRGYIPEFMTKRANEFTTREELNNYLHDAKVYTRGYANQYRKNKYGFVKRNIEIARAKRLVDEANRIRKKKREELALKEFKSRGESTGMTALDRFLMGDDRYQAYKPLKFDFNKIKNQKHFEKRIQHIIDSSTKDYFDSRSNQLKANLLDAIQTNWGNLGNEAYEFIKSLPADEVLTLFETEDVFNFETFGSPSGLSDISKNIERFYQTFKLGAYSD